MSRTSADKAFIGAFLVLASNTQLNNTGNTNENTVFTGTIPANCIGPNGSFHITFLTTMTSSTNAKTFKVKFNGTTIATFSLSALGNTNTAYAIIRNRNSLSAQVSNNAASNASTSFNATTTAAPTTYAFDTSAAITVTFTIQLGLGTETASLEALEIIAFP